MPPRKSPAINVVSVSISDSKTLESLAALAEGTEMQAYKKPQFRWLLAMGAISALMAQEEGSDEVLGCVIRVGFGWHAGHGMMLVSPKARGRGLARQLLSRSMENGDGLQIAGGDGLQILAMCTALGTPMYEKMGFRRVGTVSGLSASWPVASTLRTPAGAESIRIGEVDETAIVAADANATGLDRSQSIRALLSTRAPSGLPALSAAAFAGADDAEPIGFAAARLDGSRLFVGPLLGEERAAVPLISALVAAHERASGPAESVVLLVADHPSLVARLRDAGFAVQSELPTMTHEGRPLPGDRSQYLALIHPTLG